MDNLDKEILNIIQANFPIAERPFNEIARKLGCTEMEVLSRVKSLKNERVIRRIGATFNSGSLGYTSTLCAAKVPEEKVKEFVKVVNSYQGVTHNYRRNHEYNIWFTFITPSKELLDKYLKDIAKKTGVMDIKNLPAERFFKVKVDFKFD